jgi:hypothetical protein
MLKMVTTTYAFLQIKYQSAPLKESIAWSLVSSIFILTGKSSWVHSHTQGLFPHVADDMLYQGFCKHCLHPAGDED